MKREIDWPTVVCYTVGEKFIPSCLLTNLESDRKTV